MPDIYQNDTFIYFDIETIPSQDPDLLAKLRENVTAPARYSKQESIDKWLEENREEAALEALAKTSFDAALGHVCTISYAKNDGGTHTVHADRVSGEAGIITTLFNAFEDYKSETLVGHNIIGFDIPFLLRRAVILGIYLPPRNSFPRDPKPWSDVHDTMHMWAGAKDRISMDNLCKALDIPGKEGFDGSMVAEAWKNGEHTKIATYCEDDVHRTREIHKRFLVAGW